MFWPISAGTLFGAMMSSERSTFVRRWPSVPDLPAFERRQSISDGDKGGGEERYLKYLETYSVACGKFLFGANDGSATLGLVNCSLSSDDGFALRGASAGLAPDFGYGVPIV